MPSRDVNIARRVGLRYVLWGCLGAFAVASLLFGGPHNAAWFAADILGQILVSVSTLVALVWFAAPRLAPSITRWGRALAVPTAALSFLLAVTLGSAVNVVLSARPGEPEPFHDYFVKPMFWLAFLGVPLAAIFGAFLPRSLSQSGYGSGAA
jgi:hypothetical protein